MSTMTHCVDVVPGAPGFLLPIIRNHDDSNQHYVQVINDKDKIASFNAILIDSATDEIITLPNQLELEITDDAIWIFRDAMNDLIIGTRQELIIGCDLIVQNLVKNEYHIVAAEFIAFCDAETRFIEILQHAYRYLNDVSALSASVWLDMCLLLPCVRKDVTDAAIASFISKDRIDVYLVTVRNVSHIYISSDKTFEVKKLERWRQIAAIFNISKFIIHRRSFRKAHSVDSSLIVISGFGGTARLALERSRYGGHFRRLRNTGNIYQMEITAPGVKNRNNYISIAPSKEEEITDAVANLNRYDITFEHIHLINIRPIGFGTSRTDRLGPFDIASKYNDLSCVWIIASHRQQKYGMQFHSLNASTKAAKFARGTLDALSDLATTNIGSKIFNEMKNGTAVGLVGLSSYRKDISLNLRLREVILSMLCEDMLVASASRIVLVVPIGSANQIDGSYKLGGRELPVQIFERKVYDIRQPIIGLALNISPTLDKERAFFDFCFFLISQLGDVRINHKRRCIDLLFDTTSFTIYPSINYINTLSSISSYRGSKKNTVVVTCLTVKQGTHIPGIDTDIDVIHYSRFDQWITERTQLELWPKLS